MEQNYRNGRVVAVNLNYHILDNTRQEMLVPLAAFKNDFYLAGGTGLALQLGHRVSEDFDLFTDKKFENKQLLRKLSNTFNTNDIEQIQNEENTLTVLIRDVKISFFSIEPTPVMSLLDSEYFRIAPVLEIGVFKLTALLRAAFKDYVDLYFILKQCRLSDLFTVARKKYTGMDESLYLKAMLSYDDVDLSPIMYVKGYETSPEIIYSYIKNVVERYLKENQQRD